MWEPATYLRYEDERSRPFHDLLARVTTENPRTIVDLGCGPGHLTAALARRWPDARVHGVDSDPAMIDRARADQPGLRFARLDLRDWRPDDQSDLVVANASLQWVPDHLTLLARWARRLPAGATVAVQVPGNAQSPAHRALREIAADPHWAIPMIDPREVPTPEQYARALTAAGCAVDAWETTYLHLLPGDGTEHPVLSWLEGTGLRPVRAALDDQRWDEYRARLRARLVADYPVTGGLVHYPFRRVFMVARCGQVRG